MRRSRLLRQRFQQLPGAGGAEAVGPEERLGREGGEGGGGGLREGVFRARAGAGRGPQGGRGGGGFFGLGGRGIVGGGRGAVLGKVGALMSGAYGNTANKKNLESPSGPKLKMRDSCFSCFGSLSGYQEANDDVPPSTVGVDFDSNHSVQPSFFQEPIAGSPLVSWMIFLKRFGPDGSFPGGMRSPTASPGHVGGGQWNSSTSSNTQSVGCFWEGPATTPHGSFGSGQKTRIRNSERETPRFSE